MVLLTGTKLWNILTCKNIPIKNTIVTNWKHMNLGDILDLSSVEVWSTSQDNRVNSWLVELRNFSDQLLAYVQNKYTNIPIEHTLDKMYTSCHKIH